MDLNPNSRKFVSVSRAWRTDTIDEVAVGAGSNSYISTQSRNWVSHGLFYQ